MSTVALETVMRRVLETSGSNKGTPRHPMVTEDAGELPDLPQRATAWRTWCRSTTSPPTWGDARAAEPHPREVGGTRLRAFLNP